jgi:hypothetical protein
LQPGHERKPVVDLLAQVLGHHRLDLAHPVEGAHARGRHLVAHPLGVGRAVLAGQPQDLVQLAVPPLHDRLVGGQAVEDDVDRPRVVARHQAPGIGAVPAVAQVAAQDHRRDVRELGEHELDRRAALDVGPVEDEERQVAADQGADVLVADPAGPGAARLQVLGQLAQVPAVRALVDRLGQVRVADQVLQGVELT